MSASDLDLVMRALTRERPFRPGWYPIGIAEDYKLGQLFQLADLHDIRILYAQVERHYYCGKYNTRAFVYAVDLKYFQDCIDSCT